jgi:hypothetical protein
MRFYISKGTAKKKVISVWQGGQESDSEVDIFVLTDSAKPSSLKDTILFWNEDDANFVVNVLNAAAAK